MLIHSHQQTTKRRSKDKQKYDILALKKPGITLVFRTDD